jgi:hypothetical protein
LLTNETSTVARTSGGSKWQPGVPEFSLLSCVAACSGNWNMLPIERLVSAVCIAATILWWVK